MLAAVSKLGQNSRFLDYSFGEDANDELGVLVGVESARHNQVATRGHS